MKGLLIKDFLLLKNQKNFFLVLFLLVGMMFFTNFNSIYVVNYMTLMITMFTISTISYDEFDNGFFFLFTMPVSRKGYVAEKYLFGLITGGITWCLATLLTAGVMVVKQNAALADVFPSSFFYLLVVLVLLAVSLPLHLKFGAEKSRMAFIGVIGASFVIAFFLVKGMRYFNYDADLILTNLLAMDPAGFMGKLALVCILAFIFSYLISVKIMEKKQF
ncbi:ABC-2 transporter permease [Clostridium sp. Marseille-P2415]|uniref:ABC-2 transporter permease n=1 Tax=Clostridium sp. Marseille-P2415 TaxID=1805471 RepID=UPI0009883BCE|nr:ABC-2 transporter permease [Clostridium sp. Marseille-P2415]